MSRLHLLALPAIFALCAPASAAPPTDVADVFPPGTLAYAELHNPAELGPQLAAVFKGTPLEDSIPFIHEKKDNAKTLQELKAKQELVQLALLVSPEVIGRAVCPGNSRKCTRKSFVARWRKPLRISLARFVAKS